MEGCDGGGWALLGGPKKDFNYSLLVIIILFGCLLRSCTWSVSRTLTSMTTGFVCFVPIITIPSVKFVLLPLFRQPL